MTTDTLIRDTRFYRNCLKQQVLWTRCPCGCPIVRPFLYE